MGRCGAQNPRRRLKLVLPCCKSQGKIPVMKNSLWVSVFVLSFALSWAAPGRAVEPNTSPDQLPPAKAAIITCEDMVDDGLYNSIKRRTQIAMEQGCTYIVYEIDTFGGELMAGYNIWEYFMHEINSQAHTVAYVSKKAISAGALISVACEDIIMKENTRIGDCAPIMLGGKLEGTEREKIESDTRTAFATSAEANHYPEALLKSMVTQQIEVYKVKNLQTGEYEFFESPDLPKDANEYDIENKTLIVGEDRLLTVTASEALEYGIARAVVKDRADMLDFLAGRDNVTFTGLPVVLRPNWSEQMVRWINSPAVMGVLVLLALLGAYIELNTPGVGLPGLVAVICFAIIIGSKYLVGLANWLEVAVFVVGVILLAIEIFVLPGFGIAGILGIACILAGLFGMLIKNAPDQVPWPRTEFDWRFFSDGVLGLALGFVGFLVLAWLLTKYLPKFEFLSGLILVPAAPKKGSEFEVSMTVPPESKAAIVNVGDVGEVMSILRPTGKAKFGDAIVDVVAEGEFLTIGTRVEIIKIYGNRVVVKQVQG